MSRPNMTPKERWNCSSAAAALLRAMSVRLGKREWGECCCGCCCCYFYWCFLFAGNRCFGHMCVCLLCVGICHFERHEKHALRTLSPLTPQQPPPHLPPTHTNTYMHVHTPQQGNEADLRSDTIVRKLAAILLNETNHKVCAHDIISVTCLFMCTY